MKPFASRAIAWLALAALLMPPPLWAAPADLLRTNQARYNAGVEEDLRKALDYQPEFAAAAASSAPAGVEEDQEEAPSAQEKLVAAYNQYQAVLIPTGPSDLVHRLTFVSYRRALYDAKKQYYEQNRWDIVPPTSGLEEGVQKSVPATAAGAEEDRVQRIIGNLEDSREVARWYAIDKLDISDAKVPEILDRILSLARDDNSRRNRLACLFYLSHPSVCFSSRAAEIVHVVTKVFSEDTDPLVQIQAAQNLAGMGEVLIRAYRTYLKNPPLPVDDYEWQRREAVRDATDLLRGAVVTALDAAYQAVPWWKRRLGLLDPVASEAVRSLDKLQKALRTVGQEEPPAARGEAPQTGMEERTLDGEEINALRRGANQTHVIVYWYPHRSEMDGVPLNSRVPWEVAELFMVAGVIRAIAVADREDPEQWIPQLVWAEGSPRAREDESPQAALGRVIEAARWIAERAPTPEGQVQVNQVVELREPDPERVVASRRIGRDEALWNLYRGFIGLRPADDAADEQLVGIPERVGQEELPAARGQAPQVGMEERGQAPQTGTEEGIDIRTWDIENAPSKVVQAGGQAIDTRQLPSEGLFLPDEVLAGPGRMDIFVEEEEESQSPEPPKFMKATLSWDGQGGLWMEGVYQGLRIFAPETIKKSVLGQDYFSVGRRGLEKAEEDAANRLGIGTLAVRGVSRRHFFMRSVAGGWLLKEEDTVKHPYTTWVGVDAVRAFQVGAQTPTASSIESAALPTSIPGDVTGSQFGIEPTVPQLRGVMHQARTVVMGSGPNGVVTRQEPGFKSFSIRPGTLGKSGESSRDGWITTLGEPGSEWQVWVRNTASGVIPMVMIWPGDRRGGVYDAGPHADFAEIMEARVEGGFLVVMTPDGKTSTLNRSGYPERAAGMEEVPVRIRKGKEVEDTLRMLGVDFEAIAREGMTAVTYESIHYQDAQGRPSDVGIFFRNQRDGRLKVRRLVNGEVIEDVNRIRGVSRAHPIRRTREDGTEVYVLYRVLEPFTGKEAVQPISKLVLPDPIEILGKGLSSSGLAAFGGQKALLEYLAARYVDPNDVFALPEDTRDAAFETLFMSFTTDPLFVASNLAGISGERLVIEVEVPVEKAVTDERLREEMDANPDAWKGYLFTTELSLDPKIDHGPAVQAAPYTENEFTSLTSHLEPQYITKVYRIQNGQVKVFQHTGAEEPPAARRQAPQAGMEEPAAGQAAEPVQVGGSVWEAVEAGRIGQIEQPFVDVVVDQSLFEGLTPAEIEQGLWQVQQALAKLGLDHPELPLIFVEMATAEELATLPAGTLAIVRDRPDRPARDWQVRVGLGAGQTLTPPAILPTILAGLSHPHQPFVLLRAAFVGLEQATTDEMRDRAADFLA